MPLSDSKIKTTKPREKDYKLSDEKGLYLLVSKNGGKWWRLKYRFNKKEKLLALGVYPDVTLAKARAGRDAARVLLADGIDPGEHKKAVSRANVEAGGNSFEVIAREWFSRRGKKSESADKRLVRLLERDLYPYIGKRPVLDITPPELLQALRRIESRGAIETAHRAKQCAGQVFRYAIATGRAQRDPSADLKGALQVPTKTHFASITEPKAVGRLMLAIHAYRGTPEVMAALKLSPLLFCRPGELRKMEWTEVNFEEHRIEIPAEKMKIKEPHIIPLSDQSMAILEDLHRHTGTRRYVFPNARSAERPMSDNGVRVALRTLGYTNDQMTPHGFRAMARTILDEILNFRVDWIEHQLAHTVKDANGRAYNRTKHLEPRRGMMQEWANYLDALRQGIDNVVSIKGGLKSG